MSDTCGSPVAGQTHASWRCTRPPGHAGEHAVIGYDSLGRPARCGVVQHFRRDRGGLPGAAQYVCQFPLHHRGGHDHDDPLVDVALRAMEDERARAAR
jgi:hypothetical protein